MVNLKLTRDIKEIKLLIARDDLYKDFALCDDVSLFDPNIFTCSWFKIQEDGENIGLFLLSAMTDNCASFHGGLYKEFRHQHTVQILKECIQTIHQYLPYSLVTMVNSNNIPMIRVFKNAGLVHKTTITKGYKTGDMLIFGEV